MIKLNPSLSSSRIPKEKLYLMGVVSKLRNDGMSYSEISEHLNKEGIKTMRGKTWTKHSVGRFIIYFTKPSVRIKYFAKYNHSFI